MHKFRACHPVCLPSATFNIENILLHRTVLHLVGGTSSYAASSIMLYTSTSCVLSVISHLDHCLEPLFKDFNVIVSIISSFIGQNILFSLMLKENYLFKTQTYREKGRERERGLFQMAHSALATTGRAGPSRSQEPGTPFRSPRWVAEGQALRCLPLVDLVH